MFRSRSSTVVEARVQSYVPVVLIITSIVVVKVSGPGEFSDVFPSYTARSDLVNKACNLSHEILQLWKK